MSRTLRFPNRYRPTRRQWHDLLKQAMAKLAKQAPLRVIIEVSAGVAEVTSCPSNVRVNIIDRDREATGDIIRPFPTIFRKAA